VGASVAVGWTLDVGVADGLSVACGVAASRAGAAAGGVLVKVATSVSVGDGKTAVAGGGGFLPHAAREIAMIRSRAYRLANKRCPPWAEATDHCPG
jgi:hypothetical protein